jgi:hypothetical protein
VPACRPAPRPKRLRSRAARPARPRCILLLCCGVRRIAPRGSRDRGRLAPRPERARPRGLASARSGRARGIPDGAPCGAAETAVDGAVSGDVVTAEIRSLPGPSLLAFATGRGVQDRTRNPLGRSLQLPVQRHRALPWHGIPGQPPGQLAAGLARRRGQASSRRPGCGYRLRPRRLHAHHCRRLSELRVHRVRRASPLDRAGQDER